MSKKIKTFVILALATLLIVGGGTAAFSSVLKADESEPVAPVVDQDADTSEAAAAPVEATVVTEALTVNVSSEQKEKAEPGYTIEVVEDYEIIEDYETPLGVRADLQKDCALPFLCVVLALLTQCWYMVKKKQHEKKMFELSAKLYAEDTEIA